MNRRPLSSVATALVLLVAQGTAAAQGAGPADTLRVCAADDDMPYTNARGEGFEDQLATLLAQTLNMRLERVGFADPRYLVRDGIDKERCDLMLGADSGDPRLLTSAPYYRASYVFLSRTQDRLELRDWSSPVLATARLGVIPGTPAETMVTQIGRHADSFRYMMSLGGNKAMRNRFVRYDVEKLVRDLAAGEIDVAVAWAPAVARYVKASPVALSAVPVPDARKSNGEPVVFSYDTSIGVKKGNSALLARVEAALPRLRPQIGQVLAEQGVVALGGQVAGSTATAAAGSTLR
ncbi:methanol oxidation system protein MoxJ [Rubrivivax gelatinosus]|uniref:methanol oxidation system protein MoxJ n=1 Tax=Rubrivivax gelatinosus TaxID=28068 RepID=UPI001905A898|nr:methanol oxidation system protein MoxJ [Rubrivivax gelatinosus]MBK1614324.1 methanol oxidation system protein MoxJ [Rubrivivax gelatinosus]